MSAIRWPDSARTRPASTNTGSVQQQYAADLRDCLSVLHAIPGERVEPRHPFPGLRTDPDGQLGPRLLLLLLEICRHHAVAVPGVQEYAERVLLVAVLAPISTQQVRGKPAGRDELVPSASAVPPDRVGHRPACR